MIPTDSTSKRKPYNHLAGYKASRHNLINNGWVVIYDAKEQGIEDDTDNGGRWMVTCEVHDVFVLVSSLALARPLLKIPDFCYECMEDYYS